MQKLDKVIETTRMIRGTMLQDWLDNFRELTDLNAQVEMARWAKWMTWATIGSIAIGIAGFGALLASLIQTSRSIYNSEVTAKNARELGEAQARAYLHVTEISCSEGAVLATIANTGETPSPHYLVGCEARRVRMGQISSSLDLGDYKMKSWQALAAKSDVKVRVQITNGKKLLAENVLESNVYNPKVIEPWGTDERLVIVGKVFYEDVFGKMFETGFAFYATNSRGRFLKPTHRMPAYRHHTEPFIIEITPEDQI